MTDYLEHVADLYSQIAYRYDEHCERRGINDTVSTEVKIVRSYAPTNIVELGIGSGRFAHAVLKELPGCMYTGIDVSVHMLSMARKTLPQGVGLILQDAQSFLEACVREGKRLPFVIAPFTMLAHFPPNAQRRLLELLQEVADISLINVLTIEAEQALFGDFESVPFTVFGIETTLYKTIPAIRFQKIIPVDEKRCYLEIRGG